MDTADFDSELRRKALSTIGTLLYNHMSADDIPTEILLEIQNLILVARFKSKNSEFS